MKWLILSLTLTLLEARASTFVGNGGGAGDVELSVTRQQVEETFIAIRKHADDEDQEYCRCNKYFEGRSVCQPLNALTDNQRKFCSKNLVGQAPAILKLLADDSPLKIGWTIS